MNSLSDYLQRLKNILHDKTSEIRCIQNIVQKHLNLTVVERDIIISGKTVLFSCSPAMKNKLFLSKELLLEEFQKNNMSITEIR